MKRTLFWAIVCAVLVLVAVSSGGAQMAPMVQTEVGPNTSLESMSVAELEARGDTLRARRAYSDALTCYRTALRKDSRNAMLYNKAGIAELQLRDFKNAQKDLKRAIKIDGKLADAYNNMGVVFYMTKQNADAVAHYEKAIELNPRVAVYHSNLGGALFTQNQVERAVAELSRALDLDPDILSQLMSGAGTSARVLAPEDQAHYFFVLAKLYGGRGEVDRCLQCLEKAKEGKYPGINDVYKDKDFEAVRRDPRLQQIMSKPQAE